MGAGKSLNCGRKLGDEKLELSECCLLITQKTSFVSPLYYSAQSANSKLESLSSGLTRRLYRPYSSFNLHQRAEKSLKIISDVRNKDILRSIGKFSFGPIRGIVN